MREISRSPDPANEFESLDPSRLVRVLIRVRDAEGWQWNILAYAVPEVAASGPKAPELPQSSTLDSLPQPVSVLDITVLRDDFGGIRRMGVNQ